tara:strand:- start:661 stop:1938 length:1278 start_codon:yes stop_codon:yes gene_type:complete
MSSLSDIVQRVHDQLDFNPGLQQYKDSVVRRINDHYLQISDNDHWLFMQTSTDLNLKAKVEGSATVTATIAAATPRLVTGSGTAFSSAMAGHVFVGSDGTETTIGYVESTTELYLADDATAVSGDSGWSIKFDKYPLPVDCVEALGFTDRADDRGRLRFIDRRREELDFLDADDAGDPFVVIEDDHLSSRPPFEAPTLVAVTGTGGRLKKNNEYEYCYTFEFEGRESPPSPVASITTVGTTARIRMSNLEDTQYGALGVKQDSKKKKIVYRRDKTGNGRWYKLGDIGASVTVRTDGGTFPSYASDFDHLVYHQDAGPRQYVRFWYTPDQDRAIKVRYQMRPRRLQADSDAPIWPIQYHALLVYAVLEDICMQHGATGQAQLWERRKQDALKRMRNRYLSRTDRKYVKRGFDNRGANFRFSAPVKT